MKVFIVNQELKRAQRYQIMTATAHGFDHVFPGRLFSLNKAIQLCGVNNWEIVAIGDIWHCSSKNK